MTVEEMENDVIQDMEMEIEVLPSMWPDDINSEKPYNVEKPGGEQDMLEEVTIDVDEPCVVDFKHLDELNKTDRGSSQLAHLMKHWEYQQANAIRLLREELDILSRQREEVELKKLEIIEDFRFQEDSCGGDKRPISILDDAIDIYEKIPRRKYDRFVVHSNRVELDVESDTVAYWKARAGNLEKLLEASAHREQILMEKLQDTIKSLERESSPVEELSQILKRADNFLHFVLQNAPVVIGHQDNELKYRFIYNHFPSLHEQDILGKTDVEIFNGAGVKESQDFKREVLEKGLPAKREITFETELFGLKTFLIYVEPVFSKAGDTIGVNYMGMDVTDQVRKREKMAKLREEIAVQKAKETELNKTIHITEETMRAKQMLATMSHEIRSPLSGVVSMAEILSSTKLDREQRNLLNVMISSGDLVLQLINDILDLSKVESGVMKLEATKFRPREVVKHVLQTAAASLQKILTLEGRIADEVPMEIIGDVLRIRQILTNLISNAIKFTHEGKVGIDLYVVSDPGCKKPEVNHQKVPLDQSTANGQKEEKCTSTSQSCNGHQNGFHDDKHKDFSSQNHKLDDDPQTPVNNGNTTDSGDEEEECHIPETTVWLRCDVYDTGIGIPDNALPSLFKKYMQVSTDHARKYGGTGLGLAICKQLVELMGGQLTVTSRVNHGSTFTFVLPYKVSPVCDSSDDTDDLTDMTDTDTVTEDETAGFFQFQPRTLGSLFSSNGPIRIPKLVPSTFGNTNSHTLNGFIEDGSVRCKETTTLVGDACSVVEVAEKASEPQSSFGQSQITDNGHIAGVSKQCQNDTKGVSNTTPADPTSCSESTRRTNSEVSTSGSQGSCLSVDKPGRSSEQCTSNGNTADTEAKPKPKILLVEDNKINVMVARSMMKQLGHDLFVVNNGVEAVKAIQREHYDLILMDVYMPVMDGLQATRIIRSYEETGSWDAAAQAGIELSATSDSLRNGHSSNPSSRDRIPIVAMTANALSESAEECYANGMDSFVSKPVTLQKLRDCMDEYLP
ncbi:Probable histidine kinase 1 [Linum perenne]